MFSGVTSIMYNLKKVRNFLAEKNYDAMAKFLIWINLNWLLNNSKCYILNAFKLQITISVSSKNLPVGDNAKLACIWSSFDF